LPPRPPLLPYTTLFRSAADLTLRALIRLHQELPETDHLIITVHDSILVETTRDPKAVAQEMREVMLSVVREDLTADVPFEVECRSEEHTSELQSRENLV